MLATCPRPPSPQHSDLLAPNRGCVSTANQVRFAHTMLNINRRTLLLQLALAGSGSIAARLLRAGESHSCDHLQRVAAASLVNDTPDTSALTASQHNMVAHLAELIIPETDTPGAMQAGVPQFIDHIVSHWYTAEEREIFLTGLTDLDTYCVGHFQSEFLACTTQQQTAAMTKAEKDMLAYKAAGTDPNIGIEDEPDSRSPFFYKLKELTVLGYYTSEVGGTTELTFNPVPGRFDGDVDFDTLGHQWSS